LNILASHAARKIHPKKRVQLMVLVHMQLIAYLLRAEARISDV
jgi:hypothetical protein